MNFDGFASPVQDRNVLSASYPLSASHLAEQPKTEGLTSKIRQRINAAGKSVQNTRQRKLSAPDLTNLTPQSQVSRKESIIKVKFFRYLGTYFTYS
jgi:hypothetical protein